MHWYSTTVWENHTVKHHKDNLPIFPDELEFAEKFQPLSSISASPSTLKQLLPHEEIIKWVQAAKCFFEEEQTIPVPLVPKNEGLKLSALEQQAHQSPSNAMSNRDPSNLARKLRSPNSRKMSSKLLR